MPIFNKNRGRSEFVANVVTLLLGASLAQAIPIAVSPILTRLYSPSEFGVFALYLSLAGILSVSTAGRYELAILLPKRDGHAANIVLLCACVVVSVSTFTLLLVLLFGVELADAVGNDEIVPWLYFIPLSVLLTGMHQSLYYWWNRKKRYKQIAMNRVLQSSCAAAGSVAAGLAGAGAGGLIFGTLFSQAVASGRFCTHFVRRELPFIRNPGRMRVRAMARRYQRFPKFLVVAHSINAFSSQMPILLMTVLFGSATVGLFYLSQRLTRIPVGLLASSIADVFRQEASEAYAENGNCRAVYLATFKRLSVAAVLPFAVIVLLAPDLFALVFGEQWRVAGDYAVILAPMVMLQFISSPLSAMYVIAEKQRQDLLLQLSLLLMSVLPFVIASSLDAGVEAALWTFSVSYTAVYAVNLWITYRFAGNGHAA